MLKHAKATHVALQAWQNSGSLAVLGALATATGGDELANGFHCGLSHQDVAVMEVATDGKPRYPMAYS